MIEYTPKKLATPRSPNSSPFLQDRTWKLGAGIAGTHPGDKIAVPDSLFLYAGMWFTRTLDTAKTFSFSPAYPHPTIVRKLRIGQRLHRTSKKDRGNLELASREISQVRSLSDVSPHEVRMHDQVLLDTARNLHFSLHVTNVGNRKKPTPTAIQPYLQGRSRNLGASIEGNHTDPARSSKPTESEGKIEDSFDLENQQREEIIDKTEQRRTISPDVNTKPATRNFGTQSHRPSHPHPRRHRNRLAISVNKTDEESTKKGVPRRKL